MVSVVFAAAVSVVVCVLAVMPVVQLLRETVKDRGSFNGWSTTQSVLRGDTALLLTTSRMQSATDHRSLSSQTSVSSAPSDPVNDLLAQPS